MQFTDLNQRVPIRDLIKSVARHDSPIYDRVLNMLLEHIRQGFDSVTQSDFKQMMIAATLAENYGSSLIDKTYQSEN